MRHRCFSGLPLDLVGLCFQFSHHAPVAVQLGGQVARQVRQGLHLLFGQGLHRMPSLRRVRCIRRSGHRVSCSRFALLCFSWMIRSVRGGWHHGKAVHAPIRCRWCQSDTPAGCTVRVRVCHSCVPLPLSVLPRAPSSTVLRQCFSHDVPCRTPLAALMDAQEFQPVVPLS